MSLNFLSQISLQVQTLTLQAQIKSLKLKKLKLFNFLKTI